MFTQGRRIAGRYELEGRIGAGGTASVYRARDTVLGRGVAVKLLHPDVAADPVFVERLRREAQAAASLNDSNIVAVYDWGRSDADVDGDDGAYYMVMEYVAGRNLKERISDGPVPENEALRIAIDVASALESAHLKGVIHRDIKPQNILLTPENKIKVVDFGIARALGVTQLTRTNVVPGTPYYVAPEQVTSHRADGRSDIYSLGVVLYEMVTGEEPFRGGSLIEVALRHVNEPPVPPRRHVPDLSPQTESIILKALAKDPNARYQSAREMVEAMRSVDQTREYASSRPSEPTVTSPVGASSQRAAPVRTVAASPLPVARQESQYSRWLLAVPVLLLFAVAAGVAGYLKSTSGHPSHAGSPAAVRVHRATATSVVTRVNRAHTRSGARRQPTTVIASPQVGAGVSPPTAIPAPRATTVPTTASASAPTSVALVASNQDLGPRQAVRSFYGFITNHQWNEAAALWTPALRTRYSPTVYINQRFQGTSRMVVESTTLVSENSVAGTAAVNVQLTEYKQNGASMPLSGTWYLVRQGSSWMLDQPVF